MADNYFDSEVATSYDSDVSAAFKEDVLGPTVELLFELAGKGRALELAIGTGRVALPLARRGTEVDGIELSEAMVAELRNKPGGEADRMAVVIGDMATELAPHAGEYSLAYLVFNTIMNVVSQDGQTACFTNAARQLTPGGYFVVETMVPQLRRLPPGQSLVAFEATPTHFGVDEYDTVTQRLTSHHAFIRKNRTERQSTPFRYVWPSELDLMARMAGMTLRSRWADWNKAPFTGESQSHVSVWQLQN